MSEKELKLNIEVEGGQDGYTPVKGKDYFTKEDQAILVEDIMSRIVIPDPIPGKDGVDGKDADPIDYQVIEDFVVQEVSKIKIPDPEKVDIEFIIKKVLSKIPKQKEITSKQLKKKILEVGIEYTEIKNAPVWKPSSKTTSLKELDDVDLSGATQVDGKYIIGGGSSSDTLQDVTDRGATTDNTITQTPSFDLFYDSNENLERIEYSNGVEKRFFYNLSGDLDYFEIEYPDSTIITKTLNYSGEDLTGITVTQ
jgi:hypothetical protein